MAIYIYSVNPKRTSLRSFCQPKESSTTSAISGDALVRLEFSPNTHKTASKNDGT